MNEPTLKTGEHFAVMNLGDFAGLDQFMFEAPEANLQVEGKVFLKERLHLTSAEISLNKLPPGKSLPFYHKHRLNEEIYLFIKGQGEFQVNDQVFPVQEGTIVRVDQDGERCWRNTSDEDLYCVVIQSRAGSYSDQTIQDGIAVQKRVSWQGKTRI